jgi:hypothetical protein
LNEFLARIWGWNGIPKRHLKRGRPYAGGSSVPGGQSQNHYFPLAFSTTASPSASCPSECGCTEETDTHLLRWPHPDCLGIHSNLVSKLRDTSRAHNAEILSSILASFNPAIPYNLMALTQPYQDLVRAQSLLGPDALYYGYFHHSWVRLQEVYLRHLDRPRDQNQQACWLLVEKWAHLFQKATRHHWAARNSHLHDSSPTSTPYKHSLLLVKK